MSRHFPSLLLTLLLGTVGISTAQQPVVFDTDYGSFIDDVFALGLLRNSEDLLDLKMILTTAENTTLSAKCVAKHLDQAGRFGDIPVGLGSTLPPYEERASVCGIPGLVGFALESECVDVDLPLVEDGLAALNDMILASDRDDWWYIAVGGQTSLRDFIQQYPEAAAKLDTLVVMGGNWCAGFDPYPGVTAPTDETNIGCDPMAANDVLESDTTPFTKIYYVPVEMADVIGNEDYSLIVQAAEAPPDSESYDAAANATIGFYKAWSEAGRANPDLLIHAEAMAYDPETESTPMFDPCAIMVVLELLNEVDEDRASLFLFPDGVHFLEAGEGEEFPSQPRAAFSLWAPLDEMIDLPDQCPALTNWTFDPEETPEMEIAVTIALGYKSEEAKASFYSEMAMRMAGSFSSSSSGTSMPTSPSGTSMPTSTSAPPPAPTSGTYSSFNWPLVIALFPITFFVSAFL